MSRILRAQAAVLVAVVVATAVLFACTREFLAVDACLDRGGVYDDVAGACRHDVERLPRYPMRYLLRVPDAGMLLAAAAGAGAAALALVLRVRRRAGRRRRAAS